MNYLRTMMLIIPLPLVLACGGDGALVQSNLPDNVDAGVPPKTNNGFPPDHDSGMPPEPERLPQCAPPPFPSAEVSFIVSAYDLAGLYDGPATVARVNTFTGSDKISSVRIKLDDAMGSIDIGSTGQRLPRFQVDQELWIKVVGTGGGSSVERSFIIVRDLDGELLLADYNFDERFIVDNTVQDQLGFSLSFEPYCEGNPVCSISGMQELAARLILSGQSLELPQEQVVDLKLNGGKSYSFVWRGGRVLEGPPTGECTDQIFGTSLAFLVVRDE